jgi:2-polyprenyl-3-methyl-5-hydroxy-6-metoxy-1,4-benzoquinol methylase
MIKTDKDLQYYNNSRPDILGFVPENTGKILDVGCGQGAFLEQVKNLSGATTWGIEVKKEIAEKALGKADKILVGNVEEHIDSLPENYFDCITFNDVLEHLQDPNLVLKMIGPKLSENGIIIASIPNVRYCKNLFELIFRKDWHYVESGILDSTHLRFFTKKSMKRMFNESGFAVLLQKGINSPTSVKFRILNIVTLNLLGDLKYPQYVCIAVRESPLDKGETLDYSHKG